jgi:hypothetical protein
MCCVPLKRHSVKIILLLWMGGRTFLYAEEKKDNNLLISKGEHREIMVPLLEKISVGNPEVIAYKYDSQRKKLLIRGKKLGHCEIILWTQRKKITYRAYVLSKTQQLKTLHLGKSLKSLGLKITLSGHFMSVEGTVRSLDDYLFLLRLNRDHGKNLYLKLRPSAKLKKKLKKIVDYFIYRSFKFRPSCHLQGLKMICLLHKRHSVSSSVLKYLKRTYGIEFLSFDGVVPKNYHLSLKLFHQEGIEGETLGININHGTLSPIDLFKYGPQRTLGNMDIFLTKNNSQLKILANPEIILTEGKESLMEFATQSDRRRGLVPRVFSGLKIKVKLLKIQANFFLEYEVLFSRPENRGKSKVFIKLGDPLKLFQIVLKSEGKKRKGISFLEQIPLISNLFRVRSKKASYQRITAILLIKEYPYGKRDL